MATSLVPGLCLHEAHNFPQKFPPTWWEIPLKSFLHFIQDDVWVWVANCFCTHKRVGVYFPHRFATWDINTKITLSWVHKQFVMALHTLFYFLHNMMIPKMMKDHFYISTSYLTCSVYILVMTSQLILQCWWWHHNWLGNGHNMTHTWKDITCKILILYTAIFTASHVWVSLS